MNVLHAFRTYFPDPQGGIQEVIRQICLSTASRGAVNNVFTLSPKPVPRLIDVDGAVVTREKSFVAPSSCDLGGVAAFKSFGSLVRKTDVLHLHFPWPFADVLNAVTRHDAPAITTYHSDIVRQKWLGRAYSPLMWSMLKSMKIIVATSPNYALSSPLLAHRELRDKVRVVPLAIDENSLPKQGDDGIFERINIERVEPYFLFIGVPRYYKGIHTLIEAARSVDARVVIAGAGGEIAQLKQRVAELKLTNIIFCGFVTDAEKVALLKNCLALVLPSHLRSEAFGMVLIEAAIYGRPMISCEIGTGTSFANLHEASGFVVPPESPGAFAEAMNCLLSSSALVTTMGSVARERYERLFSANALGNAYMAIYREIV